MTVTVDSVLKDIRQKRIAPVYFIHGDEPYYIDRIADELETAAVPEAERGFNQTILFGKDTSVGAVLGQARQYPFMGDRQLVLVKQAQKLEGIGEKSAQALLEEYAKKPLGSTILMLCYEKDDTKFSENKTWIKAFGETGVLLGVKKLYDDKLPDWVGQYCRERGVKISPKACQLLTDHIGNDLKRLAGEIEKVLLNLQAGEEISAQTVERLVGISREYNVFELQKALTQRDVLKAQRIVSYLGANTKDNPLVVVLAQLFSYFSKVILVHSSSDTSDKALASLLGVHPFFLKDYTLAARHFSLDKTADIIHSIRQADARSKGIEAPSLSETDILRELVFAILH